MFQNGCDIGIPADPFRNSRLTGAGVAFCDHNPISNEMSALRLDCRDRPSVEPELCTLF
jgi:hypothetical protein